MMARIDYILNRITMYRLVLYVLIAFVGVAMVLSLFGFIAYSPVSLLLSVAFLVIMCWATNAVFANVYNAPTNVESAYITALILALILPPVQAVGDLTLLGWAAILAMASKYILAVGRKHVFNPAAIAVVLTSVGFGGAANWWVGNAAMAPAVLIGGFLIARKIRREDMVYVFILTVIVISGVITIANAGNVFTLVSRLFLHSSLLFFAGMMLTEPLTMPPTTNLQIIYAMITGILFTPQIHFGNFYTTPELALVLGNVYSYLVSPKEKLWLTLKEKISVSPDVVDFIFYSNKRFSYLPGQYMEWTLAHDHPDSRGNRRYLTLASSPTENDIRVGVKFYDNGSSYKKALQILDRTTPIVASQRGGSFTLPSDTRGKLVFIAGGIGVTPFRSMIRYLVDTRQARSIVLLYSNRRANDILYRDVFDRAQQSLGIRTVYTLTDASAVPHDWQGRRGRIDGNMIREEIPDYRERTFYLSGSQPLVQSLEETLHGLGVANGHIVKDYFPGLV